jgi:hypothetical protein
VDYELSCADARRTAEALLTRRETAVITSVEQVEAAFWHLRACIPCAKTLTPAERGRFVCEVALVRD